VNVEKRTKKSLFGKAPTKNKRYCVNAKSNVNTTCIVKVFSNSSNFDLRDRIFFFFFFGFWFLDAPLEDARSFVFFAFPTPSVPVATLTCGAPRRSS
jgi:hypothetical protein